MMNFRKFLEQDQPRDPDATGVWNGTVPAEADPNTFVSSYDDFETYKQRKITEDPSRANWSPVAWHVQYLFDKHHADAAQQYRLRKTPTQSPTPAPQPRPSWISSLAGIFGKKQ